jgi:UDP-N-acetylglucosamine 2-epimerase
MIKVLCVFGTRPEVIKMAPIVLELQSRPWIETIVCVTAQHREMLDDALEVFGIKPQHDLDIMCPGQTLSATTAAALERLTPLIAELRPEIVLVQGDTTTSFAASLASFYLGIPVGHVEAGLRTGNLAAPWPEEFNRRSVDLVASLLWAPTRSAGEVLEREGVAGSVFVTGNTVIDALRLITDRIKGDLSLGERLSQQLPRLHNNKRLVLVTGHRRESFNGGIAGICYALNRLAARPDVDIVWPVHPNPQVVSTVEREVRRAANVHLIPPLDYLAFVPLMMRSHIIITDSGGIQEEAPSLSKPVLVTREETERPEAIAAGTARLVGTSADRIYAAASELLDNPAAYSEMAGRPNPFGDGYTARRIVDSIIAHFDSRG